MTRWCIALSLALLSGCSAIEPYQRTDVWYPTGANAGNLAATAVSPTDLVRGRGGRGTDGDAPAAAVERIWLDHPKPLVGAPGTATATAGAAAGGKN